MQGLLRARQVVYLWTAPKSLGYFFEIALRISDLKNLIVSPRNTFLTHSWVRYYRSKKHIIKIISRFVLVRFPLLGQNNWCVQLEKGSFWLTDSVQGQLAWSRNFVEGSWWPHGTQKAGRAERGWQRVRQREGGQRSWRQVAPYESTAPVTSYVQLRPTFQ